ncbi:hypothetical protein [Rhizobium rhizophilum]|uniref:hypothetical protein n=1 Tax=Rhizobium rhizophilum TaxID=1850373 RepID=UPI00197FC8DA|nr:hypothetical protein [Rhizobium rhizophilum]
MCNFYNITSNQEAIHFTAMQVILRRQEDLDTWLQAPWAEAKDLQRPLPKEQLVLLPVAP